jgi:hypothetical protein
LRRGTAERRNTKGGNMINKKPSQTGANCQRNDREKHSAAQFFMMRAELF